MVTNRSRSLATVLAGTAVAALAQSAPTQPASLDVFELVGNRTDKTCVGHGRNVALYTGRPSRFFYATHELGDIFSAVDGDLVIWYPDHVEVTTTLGYAASAPATPPKSVPDVIDRRYVCVTPDDVVVAHVLLRNGTNDPLMYVFKVRGDCLSSADWRGQRGGKKATRRDGQMLRLLDQNVYPELFPKGLCMAIGSRQPLEQANEDISGAYVLSYMVELPPQETRSLIVACALDPDESRACAKLAEVLKQDDPLLENRRAWANYYAQQIPQFTCSDRGLAELYAFRWFLLRFSTVGGDLGFFKYPVVLEGRQAYQTYCCYSAPFLALDLNWAVDPQVGFGQMASLVSAAYEDGRLPWYTSPRTNHVPIHHASGTGLSLLPFAAAQHYLIHGDEQRLAGLYDGLKRNAQWWLRERDRDGDGLFEIEDPLETGMDDLYRGGRDQSPPPYAAVDASCYAYLNLRGLARLARALGHEEDANQLAAQATKTAAAMNAKLWDARRSAWFDLECASGTPASHDLAITTFYPFFAGVAQPPQLAALRAHLLNPEEFWLPYPVPALPKNHAAFDPNAFWCGPSWPAATSHVVAGLAAAAKAHDRTLLPQAAELLHRAARVHLQPRADFYERYNPLTGRGLSEFRDYMHSWWIDLIIRHVAGLEPQEEGGFVIDPLPLGLTDFALRGAPLRGHRVDVLWLHPDVTDADPGFAPGLTVVVDGQTAVRRASFRPGDPPVSVPLSDASRAHRTTPARP